MGASLRAQEIEAKSFEIIDREIGEHPYSPNEWRIVRRVIHATADFDFARSNGLIFHPGAIEAGVKALRSGRQLVADVDMVKAGISQPRLKRLGCAVQCHISDIDVIERARALNTTRAIVAMGKAAEEMSYGIAVIGNSPTALLEVVRLVREGGARPALIVGVPVGFVSAAEAKEELRKLAHPHITNLGRKGGSTVAAAIINAIMSLAEERAV